MDRESYEYFKKIGTPAIGIFILCILLFSCITYKAGLTWEETPLYLKVSSIVMIIALIPSICQLFIKRNFETPKQMMIFSKVFLLDAYICCFFLPFSMFQLYAFIAALNKVDIKDFWYLNLIVLILWMTIRLSINFLLFHTPKFLGDNKFIAILILKFLGSGIYLEKIIEFFMIPDIEENKIRLYFGQFVFILASHACILVYIKLYANVTGSYYYNDEGKKRSEEEIKQLT
ncbi:membrane protein [Staphylococcus petrasii]|uniref:DUF5079 family protein n=1 Tax=Staphylococcus petrasii TaxID=1276936 RepID=A0A380G3D0_9STAP|nr:DUF5079 family protein [Staphylococcus petrasii]PNZ30770.1 hypothetical protein CD137_04080 [Staphylococcus petrasii]TGE10957.1 DUF5079 family protein [Staphylococcus petrasii]TGE17653.1 DUF5079 family protein [Staphylococcus petrasii]SUM44763.1 membrane protein [Staphylococcus petrasii]